MTRRWAIHLLKFAGFTLLVTAGVFVVSRFYHAVPPSQAFRVNIEMFFVYALIISGLCWLTMPYIGEYSEHWPWPLRWLAIVSVLFVLGTVGTAFATIVVHYALVQLAWVPIDLLFLRAWRTAMPFTVVVGSITTLIVVGNSRLELSRAALQEQRLERERAERLAAEAQLASLASRVQPHFLFNTLNSIAALIRENPLQAEQTVERLASLLRSSLDKTGNVSLEQELKLVRDYLDIQKTRLADRLTFDISAESSLHADVPAFSIQTLVENSIKHVAGQRQQGVDLRIAARRLGNDVIVTVTDDGPGFDESSMRPGGGLEILQARLRATFGERAAIVFQREPGRTTVQVRVPESQ
jgi:sensor histidine kinase YesM